MLTSLINVALSQDDPGVMPIVAEGLAVASDVGLGVAVSVDVAVGVGESVFVAVGSLSVAMAASTVSATSVSTASADSVGSADRQAVKPRMRIRNIHLGVFLISCFIMRDRYPIVFYGGSFSRDA
jgi:hypothetical protein